MTVGAIGGNVLAVSGSARRPPATTPLCHHSVDTCHPASVPADSGWSTSPPNPRNHRRHLRRQGPATSPSTPASLLVLPESDACWVPSVATPSRLPIQLPLTVLPERRPRRRCLRQRPRTPAAVRLNRRFRRSASAVSVTNRPNQPPSSVSPVPAASSVVVPHHRHPHPSSGGTPRRRRRRATVSPAAPPALAPAPPCPRITRPASPEPDRPSPPRGRARRRAGKSESVPANATAAGAIGDRKSTPSDTANAPTVRCAPHISTTTFAHVARRSAAACDRSLATQKTGRIRRRWSSGQHGAEPGLPSMGFPFVWAGGPRPFRRCAAHPRGGIG